MTTKLEALLDQARRLAESDRLRLVEELLAMTDSGTEPGAAEAWAAEIARRSREIEAGTVSPIPWSEVRREMKRRSSGR